MMEKKEESNGYEGKKHAHKKKLFTGRGVAGGGE
jgi:hypothetical protein